MTKITVLLIAYAIRISGGTTDNILNSTHKSYRDNDGVINEVCCNLKTDRRNGLVKKFDIQGALFFQGRRHTYGCRGREKLLQRSREDFSKVPQNSLSTKPSVFVFCAALSFYAIGSN